MSEQTETATSPENTDTAGLLGRWDEL